MPSIRMTTAFMQYVRAPQTLWPLKLNMECIYSNQAVISPNT
ncbi:hypothetical protein EW026_g1681 [Hermanssonia centrifuga]|uniref:Uncharacterized protein n=1 Tax=Hermanssonia centrifuga TaxID=98765 RepID=A0A4S4KRI6_9APHY|nr:hypothetical protein EW026_g1681 [Hermanssonia centrifuga]